MQKPNETKQLALYSIVCIGLCILLQSTVVFVPQLAAPLYGKLTTDLSMKWRFFLIAMILIRLLPLGGAAVWSFVSHTVSQGKALATVILAPVLYVIALLTDRGAVVLVSLLISRESSAMVAAFSVANGAMNLFSLLGTAALVLLCCAGAIELYITKHTPS